MPVCGWVPWRRSTPPRAWSGQGAGRRARWPTTRWWSRRASPRRATPNGGAEAICARVRLAFDYAESEPDAEERRRLLTFVVVGGGPVGVELAGALASTAARIRAEEAREVVEPVRIVLAEAGGQVLPGVSEAYARGRQAALEAAGVEVRLGSAVTEVAADHVVAGGKRIEARTALWAGSARRAASDFLVARVAGGRPEVTERLCLRDDPGVFVIGPSASGEARRRGAYVACAIRLGLEGRVPRPFRVSVLSRLLSAVVLAGSVRLPPTARPAAA